MDRRPTSRLSIHSCIFSKMAGFFVLLELFFQLPEKNGVDYDQSQGEVFYKLFTAAVLPAIGLSLLGMSFSTYAYAVSCLAILLQLAAVMYFMRSI